MVGLRSSKDIPNNSIPIEGNEINILKVKTPAGKGLVRKNKFSFLANQKLFYFEQIYG